MRRIFTSRFAAGTVIKLCQKQGQSKIDLFRQAVEAKNIFCTPSLRYFQTLSDRSIRHTSRSSQTTIDRLKLFPKFQIFRGFATTSSRIEEFRLAQPGEGIKECELIQWYTNEGDTIESFGRLCEVQSDKATVEITSPFAGTVIKLNHTAGSVVQVGDILAHIEVEEEEEDTEALVAADHLSTTNSNTDSNTPKTTTTISTSPAIRRLAKDLNIDLITIQGTGPSGRITKEDVEAAGGGRGGGVGGVGGGGGGGVSLSQPSSLSSPQLLLPPIEVPLRGYKKAMFTKMTAVASIPHFHFCDEIHMDALVDLRHRVKGVLDCGGAKLTFLPFFIKAAALALPAYPSINASIKPSDDDSSTTTTTTSTTPSTNITLLHHQTINMGIAMATPHGLVVPNIKNVGSKSIAQIAYELGQLQQAAAANALPPDAIMGGTFTISNIGSVGGTYATPLVNAPEVAIMAVGKMRKVPRLVLMDDGDTSNNNSSKGGGMGLPATVVAGSVMNVSLGADHRVVDGATLAGFAQSWKKLIEDTGELMLHLR